MVHIWNPFASVQRELRPALLAVGDDKTQAYTLSVQMHVHDLQHLLTGIKNNIGTISTQMLCPFDWGT